MSWGAGGQGVRSVSSWARTMGSPSRQDVLLSAVLGVIGLIEVAFAVPGHRLVAALSVLMMAGSLTVRRLHPRLCLVMVLLALAGQTYLGVPVNAQLMTIPFIAVAGYSVGAYLDRRASVIGLAIGAALVSGTISLADPGSSDFGFGLLLVTAAWIAGGLVRARQSAEADAVASAQSRARQAAAEERTRIARELHDIVSHSLSVMVVQAAAAAELVDRDQDAARNAMHQVQATGAQAMAEMHHLLAVTRGSEPAGRRPQPALDDVREIVAAERAAGRAVNLAVEGAPRQLPQGLELSIFRIVQEALTNVRKHAGQSRCEVTITYSPDAVEVTIVDDWAGAPHPTSSGFGLIGMAERARLYGGKLEAGPRSPAGGWLVRCWFPLAHQAVDA